MLFLVLALEPTPKSKSSQSPLKNDPASWKPSQITLLESSGSVAPEFRYSLELRIEATKQGFFVFKKESRGGKQLINLKKRIPAEKYNKIITNLRTLGADKIKSEELPEEKVLGVNYNEFSFLLGTKQTRFYYLIQDLEKKKFKKKKDIIDTMKRIKL